jgi:hypothetical protein
MMKPEQTNVLTMRPNGFALLVTVVVLVVLASLTAGLATRLTMAKKRQQYMIDYQQARYGMDSGIKYILSEIPRTNFQIKPRKDMPDFSDLFWMNQRDYTQMITAWAATATDEQIDSVMKEDAEIEQSELMDTQNLLDALASLLANTGDGEPNQLDIPEDSQAYIIEIDPNDIQVPGPYGPPWPYVIDPIEMDIGPCAVTITIEDENAKMPLSWLIATYPEDDKRVEYALEAFGEWMQMQPEEIEALQAQCKDIYGKKPFQINAGPILIRKTTTTTARQSAAARRRNVRTRTVTRTTTQKRPAVAHTTDFAKLFHSSLLDREKLVAPLPDTGQRVETALKYLGLWGSQRVNINTAPRHVLQAAFMLALTWDEAVQMADEVIRRRQEQPFRNINALKEIGLLDTEAFNNLKNYVTTTSTFFKVSVTSRAGNACANAVLTIVKEGRQTETLMILYDEL